MRPRRSLRDLRGVWLAALLAIGAPPVALGQGLEAQPLTQRHERDGVSLLLEVDRQTVTIDGRVRLILRVEAPPAVEVTWPEVGDRLGPFAVTRGDANPPAERDPALLAAEIEERGAIDLVDIESHDRLRIALSDEVIERCRDAAREWREAVEQVCRDEQVLLVPVETDRPVSETLRQLTEAGVLG